MRPQGCVGQCSVDEGSRGQVGKGEGWEKIQRGDTSFQVGMGVRSGRTRKVSGPGLTQVRMSQAVEVILIQVGVFVLWAWGLPGPAGCSGEGSHVWLTLAVSFSLLPSKFLFVSGFLAPPNLLDLTYKATSLPQPAVWL